ncbi:translocation/assembly module TamB domain-containing protein [Lutimaribacter marinistellae]|uniref:Translocation/assembly module TamB domain-containing protein n=1 Tax=Lutimaribacter marinistellae TaxID=1820329 RepID=A0ABV7TG75_9RHOB
MRRYSPLLLAAAVTVPLAVPAQETQDLEETGGLLVNFLEDTLSGEGRNVQVRGLDGALSSRATIAQIVISDDEGAWLTINDAVLDWNRLALIRGRFSVNELTAGEILIERAPNAPPLAEDLPEPEAQPFRLPELPVAIQLGELRVDRLLLGAPLVGTEAELEVAGTLELADGALDTDLSVTRLDRPGDVVELQAAFSNETNEIAIDLQVIEDEGGLISTTLNLPDTPPLMLRAQGTGPITDFTADITLASDEVERVAGQVRLREAPPEEGEDQTLPAGIAFTADISGDLTPFFADEYDPFFGTDTRLFVDGSREADGRLEIEAAEITSSALQLEAALILAAGGDIEEVALQGRITPPDGESVTLPVAEPRILLGSAQVSARFDSETGNGWDLSLTARDVDSTQFAVELAQITAQGTLDQVQSPPDLQGDLSAALDGLAFAEPALAEAVGERLVLDGFFELAPSGDLFLRDFELEGTDYAAQLEAVLDGLTSGFAIEGEANVQADDLSRFSRIAGQDLAGAVEASIRGSGSPLGGDFDVQIEAQGRDLASGMAEIDPLIEGDSRIELDAVRDGSGFTIRRAFVDAAAVTAEASARLTSPEGVLTFDGDLDLATPDLSRFSALAGLDLGGATELRFQGRGQPETLIFDGTLDLTGRNLRTGLEQVDPLLQGRMQVTLDASSDGDLVEIRSADIDGQNWTLDAAATIREPAGTGEVDGQITLTARDAGIFSGLAGMDLSGSAQAMVTGSGTIREPSFDARLELESTDLRTSKPEFDRLLRGDARILAVARGDLDAVEIERFTIDAPAVNADVSATVTDPMGALAVDGTAEVSAPNLAVFSGLAGMDLAGRVQASVAGSGSVGEQSFDAELEVTGTNLRTGQAEFDRLLRGDARISAVARGDMDAVEIEQLTVNAQAIDADLSATITDPLGQVSVDGRAAVSAPDLGAFSGLAKMDLGGGVAVSLEGSATPETRVFDLVLSLQGQNLQTGIAEVDQLITGRTTLEFDGANNDEGLRIRTLDLDTAAVTADAQGLVSTQGGSLDLQARLDNVARFLPGVQGPLTLDGTLAPQGNDGVRGNVTLRGPDSSFADVSGTVTAQGAADIDFDARFDQIQRFVPQLSGAITAQGNAQRADGVWRIDGSATGPAGLTSDVSGTFSEASGAADLAARGQVNLAIANFFVSPNQVAGNAQYDIRLQGQPSLDAISGTISTSGTRVAVPSVGVTVEGINGTVRLASSQAQITMTGGLATGGTFRVAGPVALAPPFDGQITIALNELVLTDQVLYETRLGGELSISGQLLTNRSVAGTIQVGETNINLAALGGAANAAPIPPITHVNEPGAVRDTRDKANLIATGDGTGGSSRTTLDVSINAPNRIFVRGRGLNAELGGSIDINGTAGRPVPSGQISLIRGVFDILGRRLDLTRGVISLQGDLTPYLEFESTTSTSDGQATLEIAGPLDAPVIEITSEPERPTEEALAMLLFGNRFSELSPLVIAQMAASLATLSGGGGGAQDGLREATGVDSVDISTDEGGDAQVGLGAYIADGVYTDVTVNTEGKTEVNLNLDVTDNLTLRGTVDGEGETGVGIFFERDY